MECILKRFLTIAGLLAQVTCATPFAAASEGMRDTADYLSRKDGIVSRYGSLQPREWGENVRGVKTHIKTAEMVIALTLDACGSPNGMAFDSRLIDFLRKEKVPATLFINGRWIDPNRANFDKLAADQLFEIANHGLKHRPASVTGRSAYGINGTKNVAELVDEIELNALRLKELTGKAPRFFRAGTAYYDEVAVKVAEDLGEHVAGFSVLGDAGATFSRRQVAKALLSAAPGAVVILHMNHPESGTAEGVMDAIPELKKRGYRFVRLSEMELE
jgi:peptidoglycan/xylan/chitin deacetylase (PgdA/CDA1 family)